MTTLKIVMKKNILFSSLILLFAFACNKKFSGPEWDTNILTPLAKTSLKIKDLIDTSGVVKSNNESLLSVVYSNDVYTLENPLDSLVSLTIEPYQTYVTLQSLALGDQNIADSMIIGDLLQDAGISFGDGSTLPANPFLSLINNELAGFSNTETDIDISEFLVEAYLQEAYFDVSIENSTSFDIVGLSYEIKNTDDGTVLVTGVIDTIHSFSTYEDLNIDLVQQIGNNPVRGALTVAIGGFTLGFNGAVFPINYDEYLAFGASIHDLKVTRAIAQFPAQDVVDYGDIVDVGADGGAQLTYARIDTGIVNVKAFSSIPTDLHFNYLVPNISKNGEEFNFNSTIDDEYNTEENPKDTNFFFNDYEFDFTVINDTAYKPYNAFLNHIKARIDATDGVLDISIDDTIGIKIAVTQIKPSYARGFLGNDLTTVQDTFTVDVFDDINGTLNFETVNIELEIENEIGIDATISINHLVAKNTTTGQTVTYSGNSGPFSINRATELGLNFVSTKSFIQLDNAADLLSILPDQFIIDLDIEMNPGGNTGLYNDFIHSGASISSKINIDIPLTASIENLVLSDTSDFEMDDLEIPEGFTEGTLSILVDNGFPLDMGLTLYFTNDFGVITDSLTSNEAILSATVDGSTQTVTESVKTKLDFKFDKSDLENLLRSTKMIAKATFDSANHQVVKIYDYYSMDIQFVADFNFQVNKK